MEKRYTAAEIEKILLERFDDDNFDDCSSTDSDIDEEPQLAFWNNTTAESNSYEVPQWLSSIHQQEEQPASVVNASNQTPNAAFSQEQNRPPIPFNFLEVEVVDVENETDTTFLNKNSLDKDNEINVGPRKKQCNDSYKKTINSLDNALNETNYDMIEAFSDEQNTVYSAQLDSISGNKTKRTIKWSKTPPTAVGRQGAQNVILGDTGVPNQYKQANSSRKAWELFFSANMLSLVDECTNRKIEQLQSDIFDRVEMGEESTLYPYMRPTSVSEVLAFFGLMYLRGLLGLRNHDVHILFNDLTGNPIFGATMSCNRFKFLFANICFDDSSTRPERWLYDRFAAIRTIFQDFNYNCSRYIVPDDYLSLDETLYPMRVKIGFKQFNSNKPAKYGMLFKSINACRYPYTFRTIVYSGRPKNYTETEKCKYYFRGTDSVVKVLVEELEKHVPLAGRSFLVIVCIHQFPWQNGF